MLTGMGGVSGFQAARAMAKSAGALPTSTAMACSSWARVRTRSSDEAAALSSWLWAVSMSLRAATPAFRRPWTRRRLSA